MKGYGEFGIFSEAIKFSTKGPVDFIDLTDRILEVVGKSGIRDGIIHVFAPHATGILVINEFTEDLQEDIRKLLGELAPSGNRYRHPWNAHSHLRSLILGSSQTIPLMDGKLLLGTWQSIFFIETDTHARQRTVIVQVMGLRSQR
ncbi:secondary thiamine-phosphate synthase enzyme YjbQ [Candidatus Bathyarchaeota archaeon]|nr:secondary thiamine-phosphate synthase enzyme YjbQ [Candidatus Bathyarchaeota archaeon]MBS7627733.1 secondary thiamine-phosphate synthase enzyme YjbQ [Candidatus Bathyarchaeota archaeon]